MVEHAAGRSARLALAEIAAAGETAPTVPAPFAADAAAAGVRGRSAIDLTVCLCCLALPRSAGA
jgi:hypothetical protein